MALAKELWGISDLCRGGVKIKTNREMAFLSILDAAFTSHMAVICLLERGPLVDDAGSLIRTALENLINAQYLLLQPDDEMTLRYYAYLPWTQWMNFITAMKVKIETVADMTSEDIRVLYQNFRKVCDDGYDFTGKSSWCPRDLRSRAVWVDEQEPGSGKMLEGLYAVVYKNHCDFVHGAARGVAARSTVPGMIHRKVQPEEIEQTLETSNLIVFRALWYFMKWLHSVGDADALQQESRIAEKWLAAFKKFDTLRGKETKIEVIRAESAGV